MRTLRTLFAAAMLAAAPNALIAGLADAQTCACPTGDESDAPRAASRVRIIADEAPPPLPEYDQPPLPAAGYMWTPGYWAWNNDDYFWVPGTWVEPPRPGLLWTPGYWAFADGVYGFHRGYWGPHVGFYGGVSYGFGYNGAGFEGGRWDGDRFFYNRTVNNFGTVNIVNVYERPVTRVVVERVSFNGGPEGVKAKPTPQELAAAKEPHVAPTVEQRRHVTAASHNEAAFVTTNEGKPPVAATARPGEFKGAAVAPAKAAGGPIRPRPNEEPANAKPAAGAETPEPLKGTEPKAEAPARKGELKPEAPAPKAEPAPAPEKPKAEGERPKPDAEPKAEKERPKPDAEAKPEKERAKPDAEAEKPKAEMERPKPEGKREKPKGDTERPKPEGKADAKPEKPRAEAERPKPEAKPEQPRAEAERPRPAPAERAAAEGERAKPEPQHAAPHPAAACHPGAPNCPK